jgi:hypothetical protein
LIKKIIYYLSRFLKQFVILAQIKENKSLIATSDGAATERF